MTNTINLELSDKYSDLEGIVELQRLNHSNAVASELWETEGFVTMEYTVEELQQMCRGYRHVIAKSDGVVVGYALVMLKESRTAFPFLDDMFQQAEAGALDGNSIREKRYFVMGQMCVGQAFRGQGVFRKLYQTLREQMLADFDLVVTEVSIKNTRSMRAHRQVGFRDIKEEHEQSSEWRVIAWDWN